MRAARLLLPLVLLAAASVALASPMAVARTEEAYVTLLYGDEFLLGARVLGKSIRDTGSTKDMVVLVSDGVSDYAERLLEADGWIVKRISLLANPNHVRPKRFWGVYTKLKIFNMTEYKKVVYLDADTIVIKSIEELFKCGKFCANLKHSERLNSGVLVVEPSTTLFDDMMGKVGSTYSYTGGDQGFLNTYYDDFKNSHVFEPDSPTTEPAPATQRLSTLYNADVGLYMLANKWMVDEKELKVIHYTLGPLKPWDWWTAWLVKPVEVWQNIRLSVEESLPGTRAGKNPQVQLLVKFLFIVPLFMLLFGYYQSCLKTNKEAWSIHAVFAFFRQDRHKYKQEEMQVLPVHGSNGVASSYANSNQKFSNGTHVGVPCYLELNSALVCFASAILSVAVAFILIPRQVLPWTGLVLMYEWTFVVFLLLFGTYLRFVYRDGNAKAHQAGSFDFDSSGHQKKTPSECDVVSLFWWLGMAFLAAAAPLLPIVLGITSLFLKLAVMVAGGIVLALFMDHASQHLAVAAFVKGQRDRKLAKSTTLCLLW